MYRAIAFWTLFWVSRDNLPVLEAQIGGVAGKGITACLRVRALEFSAELSGVACHLTHCIKFHNHDGPRP